MEWEEYSSKPKELGDLFSPGSHLSDVPPHFEGLSFARYRLPCISEQAEAFRKKQRPSEPALSRKAIATPRDNYGYRSL